MTKKTAGRTWSIELTVVGLQFGALTKEGRELVARNLPVPVELVREPENPADENAIMVKLAGDFKLTALRGLRIGHLRRNIAAVLAPKFDSYSIAPVKLWLTELDNDANEGTISGRFRDVPLKKTAAKPKRK